MKPTTCFNKMHKYFISNTLTRDAYFTCKWRYMLEFGKMTTCPINRGLEEMHNNVNTWDEVLATFLSIFFLCQHPENWPAIFDVTRLIPICDFGAHKEAIRMRNVQLS